VYLEDFSGTFSGGYGDYNYKISFIQAKDLTVSISGGNSSSGANQNQSPARPSPPPAKTYTVVKGGSLWKIAQKLMGSGARYTELYEAKKYNRRKSEFDLSRTSADYTRLIFRFTI
jgi:hypothetical protein